MPPKKKARVSQAASPDPEPATPVAATPEKTDEQILNDPWTDDEEIGLFKGLMRWKPTGIHKHFRLMALHSWMLENNYIHPRNEHTKPPGIWAKLNTLYDLPALDARENARQLSPEWTSLEQEEEAQKEAEEDGADVYSLAANKIENEDFSLPLEDGFDDLMWKARLPLEKGDESDFELPELNLADQPPIRFTPSFSIEPSEAATPSSKRGRGGARGKGSKGGAAASDSGARRRSTRNTESVADKEEEKDEEEAEEEDGEEEEDEEDDEDGSEEEEEEEEDQESAPAKRRGRSAKVTRGRGTGRGRGRGRGRGK
ncbi:hypothetical protein PRZ48_003442 [Zasmidium cellare]|uniref:CT20-domain-containing protein n=1 Tax=Zasmidium cellare TaxID=395010 RepID=A0ABR0EV31_ZASCE|nr:hypothetical protein PRZ48_003442 [Zasmidium cellare]